VDRDQGILGGDMRVTISHDKGQKEAMRIVDKSAEDLMSGIPTGPVRITEPEKSWNGNTMNFSFKAKMGLFRTSIKGTVLVTDKHATIDVELPGILKNFLPEEKIRAAVETKVRGLLA
jgi:hypothetical protein